MQTAYKVMPPFVEGDLVVYALNPILIPFGNLNGKRKRLEISRAFGPIGVTWYPYPTLTVWAWYQSGRWPYREGDCETETPAFFNIFLPPIFLPLIFLLTSVWHNQGFPIRKM